MGLLAGHIEYNPAFGVMISSMEFAGGRFRQFN